MKKSYNLFQVDSFTKEKFLGNPAGVITNADGLSESDMQKIARELNNSETAFILPPPDNSSDVWVRFFTPSSEVPICGHATIAAHYARAVELNLDSTTIVQKTGAGNLPVEIKKENDDFRITMTQGKVEFGEILENEYKDIILSALKISNEDLIDSCPIQIVSTGHSKVMIGIKSYELLNNLTPDFSPLSDLSKIINCNGYYVFTLEDVNDNCLVHGRMFAPVIGINEDPVTGNANGPLGAYLIKYKLADYSNDIFRFSAKQGEAIGRTGIIDVEVRVSNSNPVEVKISGNAVIVFQTILEF